MKNRNLSNLFNKFQNTLLFHIHTIQPGKIEAYYGHTQKKAKVQPLIKLKDSDNNIYTMSPIDNVPVIFPCSGDFELKFPINAGDGVLLLFSELPLGNYLNSAGLNLVDADDSNKFELTDCIAIPGLYNFNSVPAPTCKIEIDALKNIILNTTSGEIKIEPSGSITLNNGTEAFVKGNVLNTWITTLISIFNAHTHTGVQAGAGSSGTPSSPLTPPVSLLSTLIKGL